MDMTKVEAAIRFAVQSQKSIYKTEENNMKKTLSILLLLCMAFATAFVVVSCGKTQSKDKLSPEERAAVDEVMKSFYSAPEKKDEGVYEENEYGISMTYEYDKNRNLVKVYQGEGEATATLEYDEKDRLAKVSVKNAEGKSTATYVMTYTDRGFISEIAGEIANDETQYSRKTSFVYDEKDRVIKNEIVQSDETVQLIEVAYDEKARVITMTGNREYSKTGFKVVATYNEDWKAIKNERFDENGTLVYAAEFDGNGHEIRTTYYDENGSISMIYRCEYDEKGNLTKAARYDETETLQAYDVYEYDENGYVLKGTQYSASGVKTGYTEYFENTTYINKYAGQRRSESYDSDGNLSSVYEYNRNGETTKSENYRNGKLWSAEENEYDESGNLIKSSSYDADRKFTSYSVYGYNESGKRIKISKYDGSGTLTEYTEIKRDGKYVLSETVYDADGNKTEYTEYLENTSDYATYSRKKRYEKYENGKLAELTEYNEDGAITKRTSYDGDGNKTMYTEYITLKVKHNGYEGTSTNTKTRETYNDGKLEHRTEYEYDENGNRTKISEYDGDGKLTEYTETKYDGERILSESRYDGNGKLIRRTEDEYDENGKKLKSSVYNNGGLESYKSYHYNESGRLIKVTACDAYNRIVNYYEIEYTDENGNGKTHEYDKNGNLLGTYPWVIFR